MRTPRSVRYWCWRPAEKETLFGTEMSMQSDRLGADTPLAGITATGRPAPQMLSLDGDFNFMLGLVASFSAAAGGGRTLKDYEDFNGDGYPDIRNGSEIEYTGPRGALATINGNGFDSYDTALALGGGIEGTAISISSSGGSSRNDDGGENNVEPTTTKSSRGMELGLGFDINAQWTNPIGDGTSLISGSNPDAPDVAGDAGIAAGVPMDQALIDMNGDGLPDLVTSFTSDELWVNLNLGYRLVNFVSVAYYDVVKQG